MVVYEQIEETEGGFSPFCLKAINMKTNVSVYSVSSTANQQ